MWSLILAIFKDAKYYLNGKVYIGEIILNTFFHSSMKRARVNMIFQGDLTVHVY